MLNNSEKGVSLVITFFVMIIILAIVSSVSAILYSEVKVMRNIGNSVASFYVADSGIEKVLFYDRQVVPTGAKRGLCSIFDSTKSPKNSCTPDSYPTDQNEHSIYCSVNSGGPTAPDDPQGTNCSSCTNCSISFSTTFGDRKYFVNARVYPDGSSSVLEINSRGTFGGAQRQIQISTISPNP